MTYVGMTKPSDKSLPAALRKSRKTDTAFELWLQRGLHQIFDEVAREPIPDDLLKLIEENREDTKK